MILYIILAFVVGFLVAGGIALYFLTDVFRLVMEKAESEGKIVIIEPVKVNKKR